MSLSDVPRPPLPPAKDSLHALGRIYQQQLDPLAGKVFWLAALVHPARGRCRSLVLFYLLVPRRWLAPKAGAAAAARRLRSSPSLVYGMPAAHGRHGLRPRGRLRPAAGRLDHLQRHAAVQHHRQTGQFDIVRRSVAGLSGDARIQAILIGFAFGAFLEGAAGGGTPVAICGAIMVGLGFNPFLAAVLCLIANTSPVAYGGLGTPLITLTGVTGTADARRSASWPAISCRSCRCSCRCTWSSACAPGGRRSRSGRPCSSPAARSPSSSISSPRCTPVRPGVVLYPMTDIGGGIFSLVVTADLPAVLEAEERMALRHAAGDARRRTPPPRSTPTTRTPPRRRPLERCSPPRPPTATTRR